MIFIEVAAEVFAEVFGEGGFDEGQIGVEGAGGESDAQELAAAGDDVVFKPPPLPGKMSPLLIEFLGA